jgi:hypothetical protein
LGGSSFPFISYFESSATAPDAPAIEKTRRIAKSLGALNLFTGKLSGN